MSSKGGWSEEKTDLFGNKYVQHYDESGNKIGWSEERAGIFGDEYSQHYDQSGNKEGWSDERTGIFGDKYSQHHDQSGNKEGWSEERTGIFGDKYTQHHDVRRGRPRRGRPTPEPDTEEQLSTEGSEKYSSQRQDVCRGDEPAFADVERSKERTFAGSFVTLLLLIAGCLVAAGLLKEGRETPGTESSSGGPSFGSVSSVSAPRIVTGPTTIRETRIPNLAPKFAIRADAARLPFQEVEVEIKEELARHGFRNIGVSVSRRGDVFLAGKAYSSQEIDEIVRLVSDISGVGEVQFRNPQMYASGHRAYLGVRTPAALGIVGARVAEVTPGSPAQEAGIEPGDIIKEVDGKVIRNSAAFHSLVAKHMAGQKVHLTILRGGRQKLLVVRFSEVIVAHE